MISRILFTQAPYSSRWLIFVVSLMAVMVFSSPKAFSEQGHNSNKHHNVGLFLGVSDNGDDTEQTIGLEYEYKITPQWGWGAVYEKSPNAHHDDGVSVYLLSAYWHPAGNWRLGLGKGKEKVHGSHGHTEDLTRVSIAYDFHVGRFGIAPGISLDRVDGENIRVYGISFNKSF